MATLLQRYYVSVETALGYLQKKGYRKAETTLPGVEVFEHPDNHRANRVVVLLPTEGGQVCIACLPVNPVLL
jgi:hypothetical protein